MKTLDGPDFYGHTIFCDDIRHEVGNKISYVGVYAGHLYFAGVFPLLLPKFGFGIHYFQRVRSYVPPKKFFIFLPGISPDDPGNPSIELEVEEPKMPSDVAQDQLDEHQDAVCSFSINHILAPLILQKPGAIFVRALRGNEEMVRLGALHVIATPPRSEPPDQIGDSTITSK